MLFIDHFFKWCLAALFALVATVFAGGILISFSNELIAPPHTQKIAQVIEASNLRQIAQACQIYAMDNHERLPDAVDLPDFARLLAIRGGLNDASVWLAHDTRLAKDTQTVLQKIPGQPQEQWPLTLGFADRPHLVTVVLGGITLKDPPHTPIAWTRGLDIETGRWRADSPYGESGGLIVSLGGQTEFFRDLHKMPLVSREGLLTHRIRDTLPPAARISADPASKPASEPTLAGRLRELLFYRIPEPMRIAILWSWPLWMLALFAKLTLAIARTWGVPIARVRVELRPRWLVLAPLALILLSVVFQV